MDVGGGFNSYSALYSYYTIAHAHGIMRARRAPPVRGAGPHAHVPGRAGRIFFLDALST